MTKPHPKLSIALAQCSIDWEDKPSNLARMQHFAAQACGKADLIVFPETMSTGFSMKLDALAEPAEGESLQKLREIAQQYNLAILTSLFVIDAGKYFNRAYLIKSDGSYEYQDKRHLFRLGGEHKLMSPSTSWHCFDLHGWSIFPVVCYDLRFPVWCRNSDLQYDLMICIANWPEARAHVWNTLLEARAMENMAYVCGVNRVGTDAMKLVHRGDSKLISPRGDTIVACSPYEEELQLGTIEYEPMNRLREKFPVWKDADAFELK